MKEPIPAKTKPIPVPRESVAIPARGAAANEVRLLARFYRRVKPQRVFPLEVEVYGPAGDAAAGPVVVRPVIPGAHVIPTEQSLNLAMPGSKVIYYVTPHARGTLRGARLDILQQNRLLQQVPLGIRSVTQRLTWVLAALTILVPAFLLWFTVYRPLEGAFARSAPRSADTRPPDADGAEAPKDDAAAKAAKTKIAGEDGQPIAGAAPPEGGAPQGRTLVREDPHQRLEREILEHVPEAAFNVPWRDEPVNLGITSNIAWGLRTLYEYAITMKNDRVSFWVGVVFLGLTIASAVTHRPVRGRRRSQPLGLAPSAGPPVYIPAAP